jgi:hypothetical protein
MIVVANGAQRSMCAETATWCGVEGRPEPDYHIQSRNLHTPVGHATDGSVSLAATPADPTSTSAGPSAGAPRTTSAGS